MRPTVRLLAAAKSARTLEPFTPTGLTGLFTHPNPRPTLIYLYSRTLEKLRTLPESSVYRKSTEALTRKRLKIVESVKPPGFDEWHQKVQAAIAKTPEKFKSFLRPDGTYAVLQGIPYESGSKEDELWGGEPFNPQTEGGNVTEEEMEVRMKEIESEIASHNNGNPPADTSNSTVAEAMMRLKGREPGVEVNSQSGDQWDPEPALQAEQVSDIENQIGGGLIEEVVRVAEGELNLIDEMVKDKVWEELEEKPKPGQWTYFER